MLIREPSSRAPSMIGLLSETGRPILSDIARKVTSHIYTENPADRSIFIEGKAYEIGDRYESIEIRDISEEGITIRMINSGPDSKDLTLSLVENWLQQSGKN